MLGTQTVRFTVFGLLFLPRFRLRQLRCLQLQSGRASHRTTACIALRLVDGGVFVFSTALPAAPVPAALCRRIAAFISLHFEDGGTDERT